LNCKKYWSCVLSFIFLLGQQVTYAHDDPIEDIQREVIHLKYQEDIFSDFLRARNRNLRSKFHINRASKEVTFDTVNIKTIKKQHPQRREETITIEEKKTESIYLYKRQIEIMDLMFSKLYGVLEREFIEKNPKTKFQYLGRKILDSILYPPTLIACIGFIPHLDSLQVPFVDESFAKVFSAGNTLKASAVTVPVYRSFTAMSEFYKMHRNTSKLFRLEKDEFEKELKIIALYAALQLAKPARNAEKKIKITAGKIEYEKIINHDIIDRLAGKIINHILIPETKTFTEHCAYTLASPIKQIYKCCRYRKTGAYQAFYNEGLIDQKTRGNHYYTQLRAFYSNLPSYNLCFYKNYDILHEGLELFWHIPIVNDGGESAF